MLIKRSGVLVKGGSGFVLKFYRNLRRVFPTLVRHSLRIVHLHNSISIESV